MTRLASYFTMLMFVCMLQILAPHGAYATVTLNDGGTTNLEAVVRDRNVAFPANTIDALSPLSLPFSDSHTATVGNSSSQVEYVFSQTGFEITSTTARDGSLDSFGNAQGNIFFSVSIDTPYSLSGNVAAVDPSAKSVQLAAALTDVDTLGVLFSNEQSSFGVVDESFLLGGTSGNSTNELTGSLSGLLLGGHRYQLNYGNSIYAANAGSPASATGSFTLLFVPEPSTACLSFLLASVSLMFCNRRNRQRLSHS